ncbi:hypothetical protein SSX86_002068 [Deinandra increscens subsp. villosa]|uniref:Uncharacterized protein n=1 Tax=Deinandra increscens subsp. villosa TaxID=3103831 RepID=A0AAP0DMW7_9ASTR
MLGVSPTRASPHTTTQSPPPPHPPSSLSSSTPVPPSASPSPPPATPTLTPVTHYHPHSESDGEGDDIPLLLHLAFALDYIHNNVDLKINLVHKYMKSSSLIVIEPSFNAQICHFGTTELFSEMVIEQKAFERRRRDRCAYLVGILSDEEIDEIQQRSYAI